MTLLTRHIEAGWREVETLTGKAAERFLNRPGQSASTIRVEADTQDGLHKAIDLREHQLTGAEEPIKDTITDDGRLVSGDQHESLKTEGLDLAAPGETVIAPGVTDTEPVPSSAELRPEDVQTVSGGVVPQAGVADTETYKPVHENAGAPADASSGALESQSTPSGDADPQTPTAGSQPNPSDSSGQTNGEQSDSSTASPADVPLSDEERARLRAEEDGLESAYQAQKNQG